MNKTAILDINWQIAKLKASIPAQLIQISPQMTMTTDAAPSRWGSILENELEMIALAHGTWNKRQAKLTSNKREIKAITQGLRSLVKTLKNSRVQSLAIRSDNSALDNRKAKNLDPDYLPPRNLFSQHLNNLLPRFMSTIRGHGETAIDALNQTWKMELPWIHPPIPLIPAVLKKIREEQIEAMIIAPLRPGQIWYAELVNENARSLMLGWSNEILKTGTSLFKKNLKFFQEKYIVSRWTEGQKRKKTREKDFDETSQALSYSFNFPLVTCQLRLSFVPSSMSQCYHF
ncbi:MAG: hypothetical protein EZS28_039076, partial [Streblomastix strix]